MAPGLDQELVLLVGLALANARGFPPSVALAVRSLLAPLIRRTLGLQLGYTAADGNRRTYTNEALMFKFRISSVASELRAQRLMWLYDIINIPSTMLNFGLP